MAVVILSASVDRFSVSVYGIFFNDLECPEVVQHSLFMTGCFISYCLGLAAPWRQLGKGVFKLINVLQRCLMSSPWLRPGLQIIDLPQESVKQLRERSTFLVTTGVQFFYTEMKLVRKARRKPL